MKAYVALTDDQLFRFWRRRPELEEVNFWRPTGGRFRALKPGEPFLFKLHSPRHFIVGGGFFAHASRLPCSLVWEIFGEKNGAHTLAEMRRRIERYRQTPRDPQADYPVGCIVLQRPFFFDESDWIPPPRGFSKAIVQGKTYDTSGSEGRALWEAVRVRLQAVTPIEVADPQADMFGEPVLIPPGLGPGAFRVLVTDAYRRRCAVSGEPALAALRSVYVRPPAEGGLHRVDNGLLLRADLGRLFERGYAALSDDYRFELSPQLAADFGPETAYAGLAGAELTVPDRPDQRPRPEFLAWHRRNVYRA